VVQPQAMWGKSGKDLADFVGNSSIISTNCMSIAENRSAFWVNEAILTHTHWSIQSVHDRCVALAECGQTPHLPPARRSSIPTIDPV
jgi:hypothetical protein